MKFSFRHFTILPVVLGVLGHATSELHASDENLTTGQVPLPLEIKEARFSAPGLIHWLGDPQQRASQVDKVEWTGDGTRLYARTLVDPLHTQVWSGSEHSTKLRLRGFLPLRACGASKDGRWLAGVRWHEGPSSPDSPPTLGLYYADSLLGVWESRCTDFWNVERVLFSWDGKYLIIAGPDGNKDYVVSVLDTASGHRLKKFSHPLSTVKMPASGEPWVGAPVKTHDIEVGQDFLLLPPVFDEKERILRVALPSLETTPVTEPMEGDSLSGQSLTLSNDDRWLASLTPDEYRVLEKTPTGYVKRFSGNLPVHRDNTGMIWGDRLESLSFSPDSRRLLVSSAQRFKVIGLPDQNVIYSGDHGMMGEFAPDGQTFWTSRPIFRAFDTATWAALPDPSPGAQSGAESLHFSLKGYRLLLGSRSSSEVWDIDGAKPLFYLKPPKGCCLGSSFWSSNGEEVYGSYPESYLRWKVPHDAGSAESQDITGEPLFQLPASWQTMRQEDRDKHYPFISGHDPVTDSCLLSIAFMPTMTELREPSRPAVVRHFKVEHVPFMKGFFGTDGKEIFYSYDAPSRLDAPSITPYTEPVLCGYHLDTDAFRSPDNPPVQGHVVGVDRQNHRVVILGESAGITVLDEKTLQPIKKLYPPPPFHWSLAAALSPDGRWLFCRLGNHSAMSDAKLALVDLQEGKLAFLHDELDARMLSADFSADSAFLALGHTTGPVSIWRVADMVAAQPTPVMALSDQIAKPSRPATPINNVDSLWVKGLPEPFTPKSGGSWTVDQQGAVTDSQAPSFRVGQWLVNGVPMCAVSQAYRQLGGETSSTTLRADLRDDTGQLLLSRTVGLERLDRISYLDQWQNLGSKPLKVKLSMVWSLGANPENLRSEAGSPLSVEGDQLHADGTLHELAALISASTNQPAKAICLGLCSDRAAQPTVLRWDAAHQAILSEWTLELEPFQSRAIYQHLVMQPSVTGAPQLAGLFEITRRFGVADFGPTVVGKLINFTLRPDEKEAEAKRSRPFGIEPDGSQKDALGFHWFNAGNFDGMQSELQGDRILSLLVNHVPVSPAGNGQTELTLSPRDHSAPTLAEGAVPDTSVLVQRRTLLSLQESLFIAQDTFINTGDHPVTLPVDLLVRGKTPIVSAVTRDGKPLNLAQSATAKECGGRVALVFAGEQKPGIALGLGCDNALISATLRQLGESSVILHYVLTLKPGEKAALAHVACPRAVGGYGKPSDVLTGMRSPLEFYRLQGPDTVAPENWTPATEP